MRIFLAILGVFTLFGGHTAWAQSANVGAPGPTHSTAYCKQSALTNRKFMRSIETIVAHGDLADIPFMEKTLGTKFSMAYGLWNGNPDHNRSDYNSNQMFGAPIQVVIDTYAGKLKKNDIIASISFNGNPVTAPEPRFLQDCLNLTRNDFYPIFGAEFQTLLPLPSPRLPGEPYAPPTYGVAFKNLNNVGDDGSQLQIGFGYNLLNLKVSDVGVTQRK